MEMVKIAHPFETARMGAAPFRFLFCYSIPPSSLAEQNPEAYNNALKEMPRNVGVGSCQCCGMAIMHNYIVESADGIKSAVGCECIRKTGQKTLITAADAERRNIERRQRLTRAKAAREKFLDTIAHDGKTYRQIEAEHQASRNAEKDARVAAQRAAQKVREDEARQAVELSRHVGKVGDRVELALIYSHAASFPGAFGTFYIQTFRTQDGATVVYKGGTPISRYNAMSKGDRVTVKATVNDHSEYNGVKQTIISRAKVLEEA